MEAFIREKFIILKNACTELRPSRT